MHVLKLATSCSFALNSISNYTISFVSFVTILIVLVIDDFLVFVSEKGGSTSIAFLAASAYDTEGNAKFIFLNLLLLLRVCHSYIEI